MRVQCHPLNMELNNRIQHELIQQDYQLNEFMLSYCWSDYQSISAPFSIYSNNARIEMVFQ